MSVSAYPTDGLDSQHGNQLWVISHQTSMCFKGQPAIYAERFIRTRLEEEVMAVQQSGSRW